MTDSQTLWKLLAFKDQSAFNYANKPCMPIRENIAGIVFNTMFLIYLKDRKIELKPLSSRQNLEENEM